MSKSPCLCEDKELGNLKHFYDFSEFQCWTDGHCGLLLLLLLSLLLLLLLMEPISRSIRNHSGLLFVRHHEGCLGEGVQSQPDDLVIF